MNERASSGRECGIQAAGQRGVRVSCARLYFVILSAVESHQSKTGNRNRLPAKDPWPRFNALAVILIAAFLFFLLITTVAQWRAAQ
jgi:hypothetical protein